MTARNDAAGQPAGDEHQRCARYQQDLAQVREEDEAELLATPMGQATPVPPGVTPSLLAALWQERRPLGPPIAHTFRSTYADRWLRFHSLPDSKRYPESEDEYAIALDRYNTVLDELFTGLEVFVVTVEWSNTRTGPEHYRRHDRNSTLTESSGGSNRSRKTPTLSSTSTPVSTPTSGIGGTAASMSYCAPSQTMYSVGRSSPMRNFVGSTTRTTAAQTSSSPRPRNETSFATGTPTGPPATQPVFDKRGLLAPSNNNSPQSTGLDNCSPHRPVSTRPGSCTRSWGPRRRTCCVRC
jgi:hypothetical protein